MNNHIFRTKNKYIFFNILQEISVRSTQIEAEN